MSRTKQKMIWPGIAVILVLVFLLWLNVSSESQSESDTSAHETPAEEAEDHDLLASKTVPSESILPYKSRFGDLPSTLEGTLMEQSLQVDELGNLRISSDIRRVFDFFLSAIEQEDLEVILNRIKEYLDYTLDEPALSQAIDVLNQYVAFKKALFDFEIDRSDALKQMMEQGGTQNGQAYLALLKEQLATQKSLRQTHLSPDVHDAFYADEEIYDDYTLARMEVSADSALSDAEKEARYALIDQQAPPELVASRREAQITDVLKQKTADLKAQGASSEEIKALRTDMFGAEAAERFEVLDQQRSQWQARLDQYLRQRQAILQIEGLSDADKASQIQELKQRDFDSREQIRLGVYERKADAVK